MRALARDEDPKKALTDQQITTQAEGIAPQIAAHGKDLINRLNLWLNEIL